MKNIKEAKMIKYEMNDLLWLFGFLCVFLVGLYDTVIGFFGMAFVALCTMFVIGSLKHELSEK